MGCLLLEKGHVNTGDHVALVYPPGLDLNAAFYGCLYVGQWAAGGYWPAGLLMFLLSGLKRLSSVGSRLKIRIVF